VKETGLSTTGIGVYPIGLRVGVRPSAALRPFLAGHTGLFYFWSPVPDERGRQLNFAAGVGAGIQISLSTRAILTLGYRYHHLSNGFRGSINPGLDANLLYLGLAVAP
jgi:opacity protein-like surface antigen